MDFSLSQFQKKIRTEWNFGEVSNTITGPQGQITPNYVLEGGQGPLGGHRIKTDNWQADGDHYFINWSLSQSRLQILDTQIVAMAAVVLNSTFAPQVAWASIRRSILMHQTENTRPVNHNLNWFDNTYRRKTSSSRSRRDAEWGSISRWYTMQMVFFKSGKCVSI